MANEAVATVSSCEYLPWMMEVWLFRACLSTAFHTCKQMAPQPAALGCVPTDAATHDWVLYRENCRHLFGLHAAAVLLMSARKAGTIAEI